MRLQIHRKHDRQRVGDHRRDVTSVGMGGDVASPLALFQADGQAGQTQRSHKKAQRVPGKQVGDAEGQRYSHRQ